MLRLVLPSLQILTRSLTQLLYAQRLVPNGRRVRKCNTAKFFNDKIHVYNPYPSEVIVYAQYAEKVKPSAFLS